MRLASFVCGLGETCSQSLEVSSWHVADTYLMDPVILLFCELVLCQMHRIIWCARCDFFFLAGCTYWGYNGCIDWTLLSDVVCGLCICFSGSHGASLGNILLGELSSAGYVCLFRFKNTPHLLHYC